MSNITHWSDAEHQEFTHKLEQMIHGPDGSDQKIGFVMIWFPVTESSKATVMSNIARPMCISVLYNVLKSMTDKPKFEVVQ